MAIVTMQYVDTFWCALIDELGNETDRVQVQRDVTGDKAMFFAQNGTFIAVAIYRGYQRWEEILTTKLNSVHGDTIQITLEIRKYEDI